MYCFAPSSIMTNLCVWCLTVGWGHGSGGSPIPDPFYYYQVLMGVAKSLLNMSMLLQGDPISLADRCICKYGFWDTLYAIQLGNNYETLLIIYNLSDDKCNPSFVKGEKGECYKERARYSPVSVRKAQPTRRSICTPVD